MILPTRFLTKWLICIKGQRADVARQYRYYFGVLLPFIASHLGADEKVINKEICDVLHVEFKKAFIDVGSLTLLTDIQYKKYLADIRIYMATERGLLCPIQHEPPEIDEMDLKEFIKLIYTWEGS